MRATSGAAVRPPYMITQVRPRRVQMTTGMRYSACAQALSATTRQRAAVPTAHPSTHMFESRRHAFSTALPPWARQLRKCGRERWRSISQRVVILAGNGFWKHGSKPHPRGRRPPARSRAGPAHLSLWPSGTAIEHGAQDRPGRAIHQTHIPSTAAHRPDSHSQTSNMALTVAVFGHIWSWTVEVRLLRGPAFGPVF